MFPYSFKYYEHYLLFMLGMVHSIFTQVICSIFIESPLLKAKDSLISGQRPESMSGAFMLMLQAFLGWTYILHMHDVIRQHEGNKQMYGIWSNIVWVESYKIINFQTFTRVQEVYGSQHSFHPVANYDENASEFSKVLHICYKEEVFTWYSLVVLGTDSFKRKQA